MTYRKQGRPTFYVALKLAGFGKVGPYSTGSAVKETSKRIEAFLKEAALTKPDLIRGLIEGRYDVAELWAAHLSKSTDRLILARNDPPLAEKAKSYQRTIDDRRVIDGIDHLVRLIPQGARLSYIAAPNDPDQPAAPSGAKHLVAMMDKLRGEGMKPNSIARSFYTATSGLLRWAVGNKARDEVFRDVPMPHEDDTRDVHHSPEEIAGLLAACSDRFYPLVVFALLSGWDRMPISLMRPRDFDPATDTMEVRDTKNRARRKREKLSDAAAALVRAQMVGRGSDEPLWDVSYRQIDTEFQAARKRAGLPDLRFKDLRHLAATFAAVAGMNARELQDFLRHKTGKMALRYLSTLPNQRKERLNAQAEALGVHGPHLRTKSAG